MAEPGTVTGWKLPEVERELLLRSFPPKYENVDADHVTLRSGATPETPLPDKPEGSKVVGRADDGVSLECLVVEIDGTTDRPDGSTYHITWSLGSGRRAREQRGASRQGLGLRRRADPGRAGAGALLSRRLFLDADGVLADFDLAARRLLGASPKDYIAAHGRGAFWSKLAKAKNFYGSLPEMPDARRLFDAVKHLEPTILTGLPVGTWAAPQKIEWAAEHFPGVPIITCMAADKHEHMHPGDVLVDDREKHRAAYEAAGVIFIHHKNAEDSLRQLAKLFPSVLAPTAG